MLPCAVLSVAFVIAAVAPVIAVPTPFHDTATPSGGFSGDKSVDKGSWPPSYGIGPVLTPGFCSETGVCERDLETGAATVINNTVQQGLLTQDEANSLLQFVQLLTSDEGVQFLQGLETDIAPLLQTSADTNSTTTNTASHSVRSSKTAWAGTAFNGIGSLSNLANVITSNLHYYDSGNKREVDSVSPATNLSDDHPYAGITTAVHELKESKRELSGDGERLVSRKTAGEWASTVLGSIAQGLVTLSGQAKRGLPEEIEDIVARKTAGEWASTVLGSIVQGLVTLSGQAKRELPEDINDIVARKTAAEWASTVLGPIVQGLVTLDGQAKRGLVPGDFEDIVARKTAGEWASTVLGSIVQGLVTLSGQAKRGLPEDSDMLRRIWLDDLVQQMDQLAAAGELKRAVDLD